MKLNFKNLNLHHVFLALFFALFFYSQNGYLFSLGALFSSLAILFFCAASAGFLAGKVLRSPAKGALLASVFTFVFFSYIYLFDALGWVGSMIDADFEARARYIFAILALVGLTSFFSIVFSRRDPAGLGRALNFATAFLLLVTGLNVAAGVYQSRSGDAGHLFAQDPAGATTSSIGYAPDIYYIILDAYANEHTLKEAYDYDNGGFLGALEARGFYVASESRSNYFKTPPSLASSLNMKYVNYLAEEYGEDYTSKAPLTNLIQNNEVVRFLRARGYSFVNFDSGFGPTASSPLADVNIFSENSLGRLFLRNNFLLSLLYQTSVLSPFHASGFSNDNQAKRILFTFEKLKELQESDIKKPMFVFAHVIAPHGPYVVDKECRPRPRSDDTDFSWQELYLDQLGCVNKKALELVDVLLIEPEGSSGPERFAGPQKPIVIIQSDHGLNVHSDAAPEFLAEEQKERLRNFSVFYMPQGGNDVLYKSITPVNIFRVVFNRYFGTNYERLPDRSFYILPGKSYYKFVDVTETVKF